MPITQDRLNNLLTAAEHVEAKFYTQSHMVISIITEHQAELSNEVYNALFIACAKPEFLIIDERQIFQNERTRWNVTHKRNAATQRKRARRRTRQGLPPPTDFEARWPKIQLAPEPIIRAEDPARWGAEAAKTTSQSNLLGASAKVGVLDPDYLKEIEPGVVQDWQIVTSDGSDKFIPPDGIDPIPAGVQITMFRSGRWFYELPTDAPDDDDLDAALRAGGQDESDMGDH